MKILIVLADNGGNYPGSTDWTPNAVVHGLMITSQDPASSEFAACVPASILSQLHKPGGHSLENAPRDSGEREWLRRLDLPQAGNPSH